MKQNRLIATIIMTWGLLSAFNIHAQVYTCLQNGQVTYTSKPSGNCAVAKLPTIGHYSNVQRPKVVNTNINSRPRNPSNRVNTAYNGPQPSINIVPKGSDNTRKAILQQELTNERNALAQAQQALNRSRTGKGGNITELQSAVLDRQQNIQAIQRELGRM